MTLEQLEKILGEKPYNRRDKIKFVYEGELPDQKQNREYAFSPGVSGDLIRMIGPGKYEILVKAWSLKAYINKLKNEK